MWESKQCFVLLLSPRENLTPQSVPLLKQPLTRHSRKSRLRAFTLIELMIVAPIVGLLSAVTMPNVRKYLSSPKTSETPSAVGEIKKFYRASEMEFAATEMLPDDVPMSVFSEIEGSSS